MRHANSLTLRHRSDRRETVVKHANSLTLHPTEDGSVAHGGGNGTTNGVDVRGVVSAQGLEALAVAHFFEANLLATIYAIHILPKSGGSLCTDENSNDIHHVQNRD